MSTQELTTRNTSERRLARIVLMLAGLVGLFTLAVFFMVFSYLLARNNLGFSLSGILKNLFAIDSVQMWWYITRTAGLIGFILLWLSTAWGLAVSSRIFDPLLLRNYTYDFHQFLSLLSIGFIFLHIIVLMLDHYLPFTLIQVLVPFTSSYRSLWVGIGVISIYLILLVTVTFYIRHRIGVRTFRIIHFLSMAAYVGAALHGIYAGTDSSLVTVQWLYKGSFLSIVFLTAFWLIMAAQSKGRPVRQSRLEKTS